MTIDHLRDAWGYALFDIDAAIFHLESEEENDIAGSDENLRRAPDAWLAKLHRDRLEYNALLTDYPSVH